MKKYKEIFSVIMPAYNAEKTIKKSVQSILNQTYSDFFLYIIDDNSTDSTPQIINKFDDPRVILLKNSNGKGVASARNLGINSCQGTYIAFCDSDDLWMPNKLERQLFFLNKSYDVVCSNYEVFNNNGFVVNARVSPEIINYEKMLGSNYIGNLTGVYNSSKIGKVYQKEIGHEDYIMWLTILKKTEHCYCIQENLAQYRISPNSLSSSKFKAVMWQWYIYRKELKIKFWKSVVLLLSYMKNALIKRI
ncbi:glycosyltransferase family 2 protein [Citrobacter portucalensis]|uniref:glycosyltransferase family 2 protein n=1 Tax=Citrobacter portucalensis TaxID=1639133 RepID=UPI0022E09C97|nr:glycosyltransferase family 2 protein [Citrobacter portucalensis]